MTVCPTPNTLLMIYHTYRIPSISMFTSLPAHYGCSRQAINLETRKFIKIL